MASGQQMCAFGYTAKLTGSSRGVQGQVASCMQSLASANCCAGMQGGLARAVNTAPAPRSRLPFVVEANKRIVKRQMVRVLSSVASALWPDAVGSLCIRMQTSCLASSGLDAS